MRFPGDSRVEPQHIALFLDQCPVAAAVQNLAFEAFAVESASGDDRDQAAAERSLPILCCTGSRFA